MLLLLVRCQLLEESYMLSAPSKMSATRSPVPFPFFMTSQYLLLFVVFWLPKTTTFCYSFLLFF